MSDQTHSRRVMTVGLGGLTAKAGGPSVATEGAGPKMRLVGDAPWFPNLATVMDRAPARLDQLVTAFAPHAAKLKTKDAYFVSLSLWACDQLEAAAMAGQRGPETLREDAWLIYATGYWSELETQKNFGVPIGVQKLGFKARPPAAEHLQGFVDKLALRQAALKAGGEACLLLLPALLREEPATGPLHGMAYNAGVMVVMSEDAPLGERPKHLKMDTGLLRINARDFMRVDYALPAPLYLRVWRTAFENAVIAHPGALEKVMAGEPGQKNLRDIWAQAVGWGHDNWGGGAIEAWSQGYFEDYVRWGVIHNFAQEAIALAALVALIDQDKDAAIRAVLGTALNQGIPGSAVMGLLDTGGTLPKVVKA